MIATAVEEVGDVDVLLVESHPGLGRHAERQLEAAGHTVLRCLGEDTVGPCVGLSEGGACPLDTHEIAAAVVARVGSDLHHGEHGALCAARHRLPIVTAADVTDLGVFEGLAASGSPDVVRAVEAAAASGTRHEAAVLRDLLDLGVLSRRDVEGEDAPVAVSVERSPRRLVLTLWTLEDDRRAPAIMKSATEALRRFDPHVPVIDVHVKHRPR